jgi:hypothetical protein
VTKSAKWAAEAFADNDGGMTQDAAIGWLKHEYGLSEGAAIPHLRRAWASGYVRGWTRRGWDYFEMSEDGAISHDGEPVDVASYRCEVTGRLIHDLRLNADDFRWQIEQQLGKPSATKAPKRQPSLGRRGRPETPYWSKAHEFIYNWLVENGCPQAGDRNQARLELEVAELLASRTEQPPAESTVRDHVRKQIAKFKEQLAQGR